MSTLDHSCPLVFSCPLCPVEASRTRSIEDLDPEEIEVYQYVANSSALIGGINRNGMWVAFQNPIPLPDMFRQASRSWRTADGYHTCNDSPALSSSLNLSKQKTEQKQKEKQISAVAKLLPVAKNESKENRQPDFVQWSHPNILQMPVSRFIKLKDLLKRACDSTNTGHVMKSTHFPPVLVLGQDWNDYFQRVLLPKVLHQQHSDFLVLNNDLEPTCSKWMAACDLNGRRHTTSVPLRVPFVTKEKCILGYLLYKHSVPLLWNESGSTLLLDNPLNVSEKPVLTSFDLATQTEKQAKKINVLAYNVTWENEDGETDTLSVPSFLFIPAETTELLDLAEAAVDDRNLDLVRISKRLNHVVAAHRVDSCFREEISTGVQVALRKYQTETETRASLQIVENQSNQFSYALLKY